MSTLPAAGYISNAARTNAELKVAFDALRDALAESHGGDTSTQLTLASDVITPLAGVGGGVHTVETEGGAATDNLSYIAQTNTSDGRILLLYAANAAHVVTVKHAAGGTGQILLADGLDFVLDQTDAWVMVRRAGTSWVEVLRSRGADSVGVALAQYRFDFTSATVLTLSRYDGDKIFINGQNRTIPNAGVTVGNGGLSANTSYYVYAYMSGSTITLELSATAYARNTNYGHMQKSGDATRTLVGWCRTNGSTQFYDNNGTTGDIGVLSWANRRIKRVVRLTPTSGTFVTSSGSLVQVTPVTAVNAPNWAGTQVHAKIVGYCFATSGAVNVTTYVGVDGAAAGQPVVSSAGAANYFMPMLGELNTSLSEGNHTYDCRMATNGASATVPTTATAIIVEVEG